MITNIWSKQNFNNIRFMHHINKNSCRICWLRGYKKFQKSIMKRTANATLNLKHVIYKKRIYFVSLEKKIKGLPSGLESRFPSGMSTGLSEWRKCCCCGDEESFSKACCSCLVGSGDMSVSRNCRINWQSPPSVTSRLYMYKKPSSEAKRTRRDFLMLLVVF